MSIATGSDITAADGRALADGSFAYAASSTGNDTYAITLTPAPTAYAAGQMFTFKPDTSNTGAATLNVNSLGAKTIKKNISSDLDTGDIIANEMCVVLYDGTNFQLLQLYKNVTIYKNGDTTKNAADASTTQNIAHGLGRTPKKVKITAICKSADTGSAETALATAITVYNGTTQSSISNYSTNATPQYANANTFTLNAAGAAGTQTGVVTFDATNIIITWTKTNSPTGTFYLLWEAEA